MVDSSIPLTVVEWEVRGGAVELFVIISFFNKLVFFLIIAFIL